MNKKRLGSSKKSKNTSAANDSITALIHEITDISSKIIGGELKGLMNKKEILENIPNGILTYVYTAGFLSFCGKEINKKNISKLITILGIKPESKIIDIVLSTEMESHLIYVYGFYFLLSNGIKPTEKKVMDVITSIGEKGNKKAAVEAFNFICKPAKH